MKKRFFNTAVAIAAAMALSVSAFAEAAEPGLSVPGFSGIPGASTALVKGEIVGSTMKLGSSEGIAVDGRLKYFGDRTNVVLCASMQDDVSAEVQGATKTIVTNYLSAQKPPMSSDIIKVNMVIRVKLYDLDAEEYFQPEGSLSVSVPTDSESNIVAFISEDGKTVEWYELQKNSNTVMSFEAPHFSDYYFMTLDEDVVDSLLDDGNYVPPYVDETTTAPTTPVGPGGSTTTTTTTAPDATTAPDSTTAPGTNNGGDTTTAPSENTDNNGSNGGDTTNAPADGGNDSTDNNNTGNTDGTGNDKNQNTGVVLAVIPAAIAAAAVVISKKRK